jgi:hypothetical protein
MIHGAIAVAYVTVDDVLNKNIDIRIEVMDRKLFENWIDIVCNR